MGATVSGPSITVDETAETITLTAGATIPTSVLRVFGCETMTVTAEAPGGHRGVSPRHRMRGDGKSDPKGGVARLPDVVV